MSIYQEQGFEDRRDYLQSLAEDFGLSYEDVVLVADTLGENEDFDGLVVGLEDLAGMMAL